MAAFELRNASLGATMPDLFGWWTVQQPPPAATEVVAFAFPVLPPPALPEDEPVWAVSLTSNQPMIAADYVAGLFSGRDEASRQLNQVLQVASQPGGVSFAAPAGLLSDEGAILLSGLQEISTTETEFSFEFKVASWPQANDQFQALLRQIGQSVGQFAWVETKLDNQLLGRTRVNWLGDFNTLFQLDLTPAQQNHHQQALMAALASRTALLEMFTLALEGAGQLAKLPVLLSTPAGAILAIPLILRFINKVIAANRKAANH